VEALGLYAERDKHIKRALGSLIERNLNRKLSGASLVQAISAFARIDAEGREAQRSETTLSASTFLGWTRGELRRFVTEGIWPERFPR
jgi:hypothetical protein